MSACFARVFFELFYYSMTLKRENTIKYYHLGFFYIMVIVRLSTFFFFLRIRESHFTVKSDAC